MATRDTPKHYDSPAKVPPVGSDLEFYHAAFLVLGTDPDFPFVWAPLEQRPLDAQDAESVEMLTRINARLRLNNLAMEEKVIEELRKAGVPPEWLESGARTQEVSKLIERLIYADRQESLEPYGGTAGAMDILLREFRTRSPDNPQYTRCVTVRVVTAAQFLDDRPKGVGELCAFLNANALGPRLINRHHLRSVERTFRAELKETKHARIAQLNDDVIAMRALRSLKDTAKRSIQHPHLRALKGQRLAEAMNAIQDLRQAVFEITHARQFSRAKAV